MELRYVGPHDTVTVPTANGTVGVERGATAEFPDDTAKSLLEQGDDHWQKPKTRKGGNR